jgi:outer membrane protein OmpA-like peptidoglycan-associated protein
MYTRLATLIIFLLLFCTQIDAQYSYIPASTAGFTIIETPFLKVDKEKKKIVVNPIGAYNVALPFHVAQSSFNVSIEFSIEESTEAGNIGYELFFEGGEHVTVLYTEKGRMKLTQAKNYSSKEVDLTPWIDNPNLLKGIGVKNKLEMRINQTLLDFYINDKKCFTTQIDGGKKLGFISILNSKSAKRYAIHTINFSVKPELRNVLLPKSTESQKLNMFGKEINSDEVAQVAPLISADEKNIYFVRKEEKDKVYHSKRLNAATWNSAEIMSTPINSSTFSKSVISSNTDGSVLFTKNAIKNNQHTEGGISKFVKLPSGEWSAPSYSFIDNFININEYKSNFLSYDERYLLQCIDNGKGYGDLDVFVSFLKPDGNYSEPLNLGFSINSASTESYAFLAPDNITLYFSSKGLPGYGSNDIYMSKRLDESWTKWSTPTNLGSAINTVKWDGYFSTSASGNVGLVSSSSGRTKTGIFWIKLSKELLPNPVLLVTGTITDMDTKLPISTTVTFSSLSKNYSKTVSTNPETGKYSLVLQPGDKYEIIAEKEGYYAISEFIDLSQLKTYQEVQKNLYLAKVAVGQIIRLNNLFFESAKYELLKDSYSELDRLAAFLKEKSNLKIEISGHTDGVGEAQSNQLLSENRAKSVQTYLISKGINSSRIQIVGYGKTKPVADNATEDGKALNRRVEFKILEK